MAVALLVFALANTIEASSANRLPATRLTGADTQTRISDSYAGRLVFESMYGLRAQFTPSAKTEIAIAKQARDVNQPVYKLIEVRRIARGIRSQSVDVIRVHFVANGRYYQDGLALTREHTVDIDSATGMLLNETTVIARDDLAKQYGMPVVRVTKTK